MGFKTIFMIHFLIEGFIDPIISFSQLYFRNDEDVVGSGPKLAVAATVCWSGSGPTRKAMVETKLASHFLSDSESEKERERRKTWAKI